MPTFFSDIYNQARYGVAYVSSYCMSKNLSITSSNQADYIVDGQLQQDKIPAWKVYIAILGDVNLTSVAGVTFHGVADLHHCKRLTSIEGGIFHTNANLSNCTGLTSVAGATFNGHTILRECTGLTSVDRATFNGYTSLFNCTSLTSLEGATFNGDVNLSGCTGLLPTTELINQLEAMEAQGKIVTWPEHFNRGNLIDGAKARLDATIQAYREANPEGAPATSYLFNKFLSEGLGQRDGKAAVVASVSPFLELIEGEPKHLGWVEEIAKHYLQGCVNQPVAGFFGNIRMGCHSAKNRTI